MSLGYPLGSVGLIYSAQYCIFVDHSLLIANLCGFFLHPATSPRPLKPVSFSGVTVDVGKCFFSLALGDVQCDSAC